MGVRGVGRFIWRCWGTTRQCLSTRSLFQLAGWWVPVTSAITAVALGVGSWLKGLPWPIAAVVSLAGFVLVLCAFAAASVIWRRLHPALGFGGGVTGHASNFRCVQRRSNSDFGIACDLSLLSALPGKINFRRIVIDATRIRPRLAFTDCAIADVILEPGVEQKIELRMILVLDKDFNPREVDAIPLEKLKILPVDAGGRHRVAVSPGAMLFLDPEDSAPSE